MYKLKVVTNSGPMYFRLMEVLKNKQLREEIEADIALADLLQTPITPE